MNLDSALAAVDRLEAIIAHVIALARDLPVQHTAKVAEVIESAQKRWHGALAAVTRPLRVIIDADAPQDIGISVPAATQILDVLIDDALRHGPGAVTIHVRAFDAITAIDVSDEGPALLHEAYVCPGSAMGNATAASACPSPASWRRPRTRASLSPIPPHPPSPS